MRKVFLMAALLSAFVLPCVLASGQDDKPKDQKAAPVRLIFSVDEYNPAKPSDAVLKCLVRNNSDKPVDLPGGYTDGERLILYGDTAGFGPVSLRKYISSKPSKIEPERIRIGPGEEKVIFELALDEIFMGRGKEKHWGWDWSLRPEPPRSPIHLYRKDGFRDKASFWVEMTIGRNKVESEKVVLKINATPDQEKK